MKRVTCVMAKTKTRSKKSSIGRTRCSPSTASSASGESVAHSASGRTVLIAGS